MRDHDAADGASGQGSDAREAIDNAIRQGLMLACALIFWRGLGALESKTPLIDFVEVAALSAAAVAVHFRSRLAASLWVAYPTVLVVFDLIDGLRHIGMAFNILLAVFFWGLCRSVWAYHRVKQEEPRLFVVVRRLFLAGCILAVPAFVGAVYISVLLEQDEEAQSEPPFEHSDPNSPASEVDSELAPQH